MAPVHTLTLTCARTIHSSQMVVSLVVIAICIILVLLVSAFIGRNLISGIDQTKNGLVQFFDFLNNKTDKAKLLNRGGSDEIGQMSALINENIKQIEANFAEQKLRDRKSVV